MQIYNVNNSPNFKAVIKINKTIKNQVSEASITSTLSGTGGTVLSGMASEMISGPVAGNIEVFISKLGRAFENIKRFIKVLKPD